MAPISLFVESGIRGPNGEKLVKAQETIEEEELLNSRAVVAKKGEMYSGDLDWFKEGDEVLISRLGGTKFEVRDEQNVHVYWLIPNQCVQMVFDDE